MFSSAKNNKAKTTPDEEAVTVVAHASSSQTGNDFPRLKQHPKEMASMRQALATGRPLASCFRAQDTVPPKKPMSTKLPTIKATSDFGPPCMSMQQYIIHPEETEVQRRLKVQRQEHMVKKVEWIYKILCALTTMKNKDLKTSVTLSSVYVNAIMRDVEEAKVLLNDPQRSLISSTLDDGHNICTDMWESFVSSQEPELKGTKKAGYKPGQIGLRRRARLKELENDAEELPPWLNLLWNENVSYKKSPQTHREERMKTRQNTLVASRKDTILQALLPSLESEVKGIQSSSMLWFQMLQKEAAETADDRAEEFSVMQKICQFDSFSHDKLPFCKEKFCLLVLSLPAYQLLCPAMQDALMFLTKNVLQLPPYKLKYWFQHLKLPFYNDSSD